MNKNNKKVFVMMSGGVDSSVAALLLKKQEYDVIGVFMRSYNIDGCQERDAEDARRVAEKLNIPFYVWDFEEEYKKKVVEYMIDGYRQGITPNPDVMCNKEIKFGLFLKRALETGANFVASGHYVRLSRIAFRKQHNFLPARKFASLSPRHSSLCSETKLAGLRDVPRGNPASPSFSLFIAKDKNKDQSYFLWTLTQKQLKHCLFPIGDYLKSETREIARKAGLPTADKKDSQGICFLGKVTLEDFLNQYIPEKRGLVLSASGEVFGEHKGAHFYTIGQRHLDIKHQASSTKGNINTKPHYVAEKDIRKNTLIIAEGSDNPALYKKEIKLMDVNFINSDSRFHAYRQAGKIQESRILARVRYRQPLASARLDFSDDLCCNLIFDEPQKFMASGQSAVFYADDGEMLGGGIIK